MAWLGISLPLVGCEVVLGLNDAERAVPVAVTSPEGGDMLPADGSPSANDANLETGTPDEAATTTEPYNDAQFVISSLQDHTCAVGPDGNPYCWGDNTYGQLGDGTVIERDAPVRVATSFHDVVSISAGYTHSCLVRAGGDLYCWGKNDRGQLGDGTTDDRHDPTGKLSMTHAVQVGVGGWHTCALTTVQGVRCWGDNYYGALGDGTFNRSASFVDVKNLSNVTAIAVGVMHTCALTAQGKVYCWGRAVFDEVGYAVDPNNGSPDPGDYGSPNATEVPGLSDINEIVAGEDHTCALRNDGAILCWGRNDYAEYGDGFKDTQHFVGARAVEADGGAVPYPKHLAAGKFTTCGVFTRAVRCWGDNDYGQLGNGDTDPGPYVPSPDISGLTGTIRVATNEHTCGWRYANASSTSWKLFCFGRNDKGQVGIGRVSEYELTPQEVTLPSSPRGTGP